MAGQLVMGPFPLDTQLSGLAWWGWGLPASSREVTQPQPWQLVNPGSYEGGQRERPRLRPRALHAHSPKAAPQGPQGPCQALYCLSTPCQGPSAHLLTLRTPEWVFVCTPGAGWAEPRSKCWTEISPLGPGAAGRTAHLVGGRSLFCRWPVLLSGSELGTG